MKYDPLKEIYQKLKGVFTSFDDLLSEASSFISSNTKQYQYIFNNPIKSSNFIFIFDYNNNCIKLHFEIVVRYFLYKYLKSKNSNKEKTKDLISKKEIYYSYLAKRLAYDDDKDMIDFFEKKTNKSKIYLKKFFDGVHTIDKYISNYTAESIFYKGINKFLREGNIKDFRILSNHISKFIYHLYEYKKTNNQLNEATLYRKMAITNDEFNLYRNSIGKVICYPSFTSTSLISDWILKNTDPNLILVKLIIQQNKAHSIIYIKNLSEYKNEEEFLCLPFSFFKITNVDTNSYSIY